MDTLIVDRLPGSLPSSPAPRLAIVSTTSKLCGIGAYTAALRRSREPVRGDRAELDQYLPRPPAAAAARIRDHEICGRLGFGAVNLQRHGTAAGREAREMSARCLAGLGRAEPII